MPGRVTEVKFALTWRIRKGFSVEAAMKLRSEETIGICSPGEGGEDASSPNGRHYTCNNPTVRGEVV